MSVWINHDCIVCGHRFMHDVSKACICEHCTEFPKSVESRISQLETELEQRTTELAEEREGRQLACARTAEVLTELAELKREVAQTSLHQWMNDHCVFARYDAIRNEWHTWNDGNGDKYDKGATLRESLMATMKHWGIDDPLPFVSDSEIVDYLDGMDNKIDHTNTGFVWAWKGRLRATVIEHMHLLTPDLLNNEKGQDDELFT